ncbi:MAG: universal stress protein [Cyclobacteriaceae bacterium]|nr:universal stress protein [Cyclobacteriaceae bacterium]
MKKRFIILIDLSEHSSNLLKYAYDWSKRINAQLLLLHHTTVMSPVFTDIESRIKITQHTNLEALKKLKELRNLNLPPAAKVSYSVSESPLQIILQKQLSEPYNDLIFVGLKRTDLFKQVFLGSVAIQTIENSNNTVVAMPIDISRFSPEKIFVAVSDKHPLNILELNNFLDFIGKGIEIINFFHLAKFNENTDHMETKLKDMAKLFADKFDTSYAIYIGESSFDSIKTVINNKIEEILIVQKGSRLLTDQLFRKFLINELVYEGQTPLVILP